MPYGRRRTTARRTAFRRSYRRSGGTSRTFRRKVRGTIYRMAESKQAAASFGGALLVNSIESFSMVPTISQGPGDNQRIGNKIMTNWFTLNLQILINPAVAGTSLDKTFRIYVVWPKQASSTDAASLITITNFPLQGMPDQDNWFYWKDHTYQLNTVAEFGRKDHIQIKMYKRFRYHAEYTTSGATIPLKSPYVIIVWNATPVTVNANIWGYTKVSYKDI